MLTPTCYKQSRTRMVILLIMLFSHSVQAGRLDDVNFEPIYHGDGVKLRFQGAGLMKYLFFTVSAAALYQAEGTEGQDQLEDIPKRLEIEYFHDITAADFVKLTTTWVAKNTDAETFERLQPSIDRFNALYQDVQPGDRYAITYQPGKGTDLRLNGDVLGVIEGADFARALFAIWLGPTPVSRSLKSRLVP